MPQPCSVCHSPDRGEVEAGLLAGAPTRRIAARHGLSETSVRRHAARHLSASLAIASRSREELRQLALVERVASLLGDAETIYARAREDGDGRLALGALGEARRCVETIGRLTEAPSEAVEVARAGEALTRAVGAFLSDRPALAGELADALGAVDADPDLVDGIAGLARGAATTGATVVPAIERRADDDRDADGGRDGGRED